MTRISLVRCAVVCTLVFTIAACARLTEQFTESPPDWDQRIQQQQQIRDWTIRARLGVQTETEGGSFDVIWQQRGSRYDIRLIAPLGQGAVQIDGDAAGVTIRLADGRTEYSDDADRLFSDMTGLSLPVSGLQDWMRGMPIQDQAIESISWNEFGQLFRIEQGGWRVEMNRYKAIDDFELPHAFYLEREDRPELSVRLLVRQWLPAR